MKRCGRCKKHKEGSEFYGRTGRCKICDLEYQSLSRDKRYEYLYQYLLKHPCVDCGESDPSVLEFDHVRGDKVNNISAMVRGRVAFKKLDAEIAKCLVRCANCHRRKTAKDFKHYSHRRGEDT